MRKIFLLTLTCGVCGILIVALCGCGDRSPLLSTTHYLKDTDVAADDLGASKGALRQLYFFVIDISAATEMDLEMMTQCLMKEIEELAKLPPSQASSSKALGAFNIMVCGGTKTSFLSSHSIYANSDNIVKTREFISSITPDFGGNLYDAFKKAVVYCHQEPDYRRIDRIVVVSKGDNGQKVDYGKLSMLLDFCQTGRPVIHTRIYGNPSLDAKMMLGAMVRGDDDSKADCKEYAPDGSAVYFYFQKGVVGGNNSIRAESQSKAGGNEGLKK